MSRKIFTSPMCEARKEWRCLRHQLEVREGELLRDGTFRVGGENDLFNLIAGLDRPDSGRSCGGTPISKLGETDSHAGGPSRGVRFSVLQLLPVLRRWEK